MSYVIKLYKDCDLYFCGGRFPSDLPRADRYGRLDIALAKLSLLVHLVPDAHVVEVQTEPVNEKPTFSDRQSKEMHRLSDELRLAMDGLTELRRKERSVSDSLDAMTRERNDLQAENAKLKDAVSAADENLDEAIRIGEGLRAENAKLKAEHQSLTRDIRVYRDEHNHAWAALPKTAEDYLPDAIKAALKALEAAHQTTMAVFARVTADRDKLTARVAELAQVKDQAYAERNRVAAALATLANAHGWPVGIGRHEESDATWERDWMTILFIDTPAGQVSWHFHDSERHLLDTLPAYAASWDGHTTADKYDRLASLPPILRTDTLASVTTDRPYMEGPTLAATSDLDKLLDRALKEMERVKGSNDMHPMTVASGHVRRWHDALLLLKNRVGDRDEEVMELKAQLAAMTKKVEFLGDQLQRSAYDVKDALAAKPAHVPDAEIARVLEDMAKTINRLPQIVVAPSTCIQDPDRGEIKRWHGTLQDVGAEVVTLRAENERHKTARSNLRSQLEVVTRKRDELASQLDDRDEDLGQMGYECDELREELEAMTKERDEAREMLEAIKEEVRLAWEELPADAEGALAGEIRSLLNRANDWERRCGELQRDLNRNQRGLPSDAKVRGGYLADRVRDLVKDLGDAKRALDVMTCSRDMFRDSTDANSADVRRLIDELRTVTKERDEAVNALATRDKQHRRIMIALSKIDDAMVTMNVQAKRDMEPKVIE